MAHHPAFYDYITPDYVDNLCLSSALHNSGKVGITDTILQ